MAKNNKPSEENKEEVKKKWRFYLACAKCSFKFSIERESSDMNKVDITKMRCMDCNSPIKWDISNFPFGSGPSPETKSKMNIEATREALKMANEMKRADAEAGIGKLVPVKSTQAGKERGMTRLIPKKVIDSIEEKIKPEIESLEKK